LVPVLCERRSKKGRERDTDRDKGDSDLINSPGQDIRAKVVSVVQVDI